MQNIKNETKGEQNFYLLGSLQKAISKLLEIIEIWYGHNYYKQFSFKELTILPNNIAYILEKWIFWLSEKALISTPMKTYSNDINII